MTARTLLAREGQPMHRHRGRHRSHTAPVHRRVWALLTRDDDLMSEVRTLVWFGGLVVVAAVLAMPW